MSTEPDTTELSIKSVQDVEEVFRHYNGEGKPREVYIELDLRTGELSTGYNAFDGNVVTVAVNCGFIQRWLVPLLTPAAANVTMEKMAPHAQEILQDWDSVWNGDNFVVRLGDDAQQADLNINRLLTNGRDGADGWEAVFSPEELIAVWTIDGAWDSDDIEFFGITAATTDERLADIVTARAQDLAESESDVVVIDGLLEHLKALREEMGES